MRLSKGRFVFYDGRKKRWPKIKKVLRNIFYFADIAAIGFLFSIFYSPRFEPKFIDKIAQKPQAIIDFIRRKKEETIEVGGYGPLLRLEEGIYGHSLVREQFQKEKLVVLSFDDGPDPVYTPKILEVLKKEGVPAVFFVVGEQLVVYPDMAKKIVDDGHQIGTHTHSHQPEGVNLYKKQDRVGFELDMPQKIIEAQTGYKTEIFRIPHWGVEETISLNTLTYAILALDRGYYIVASTTDSFDWREKDRLKIIENSVNTSSSQIILMHDGGGDRSATVEALPEIIRRYRQEGYEFVTVDALLPEGTAAMTRVSFLERASSLIAYSLIWFVINFNQILVFIFGVSLCVVAVSAFVTLSLASLQIINRARKSRNRKLFLPFVSVLIPAFNEARSIGKTIESILNSHYLNYEIVVIDNNSIDKTRQVAKRYLRRGKVRLVSEKIQGKFAALNKGIEVATGEILIVIDADTQILQDTIYKIVQPFSDPEVGAVAGNVKVGNLSNMLTAFQSVEYIVGLNLERRAYDALSATPIVPGALGAWRKKAVKEAGGYKSDTLTEDADLTVGIQKEGYKITFAEDAIAFTEAPQDIKSFVKQRVRWTFGILQVLYKSRSMFFKSRYGALGTVILPYLGLVQLPLMLLSPVVDLLALALFIYMPFKIVTYFIIFLTLNSFLTIAAFIFARETRFWLLTFLPLARILYQGIWYYVLYKSVFIALKGLYVPWGKLKHAGSVSIEEKERKLLPALQFIVHGDK